ncbi:predicted protein [Postia placenta Mad-698-R]|uniref:Uncharacterized protein n=1 Tax=Postia placenta MAD-698-R-SB12 TaxID=670580 RepID=A0A1X6N1M0_9APHY|nr:hypothetical protein POSPLADRAFT_1140663 [Postia placenta MAD-698-R-SB12]EED79073.1 predicted protein [Postia placenta Mad-698-R]OSX62519.1 hypothetical protein POSPLADRAFT_1140663 [Postia placenta MAD-698-R-SB12]
MGDEMTAQEAMNGRERAQTCDHRRHHGNGRAAGSEACCTLEVIRTRSLDDRASGDARAAYARKRRRNKTGQEIIGNGEKHTPALCDRARGDRGSFSVVLSRSSAATTPTTRSRIPPAGVLEGRRLGGAWMAGVVVSGFLPPFSSRAQGDAARAGAEDVLGPRAHHKTRRPLDGAGGEDVWRVGLAGGAHVKDRERAGGGGSDGLWDGDAALCRALGRWRDGPGGRERACASTEHALTGPRCLWGGRDRVGQDIVTANWGRSIAAEVVDVFVDQWDGGLRGGRGVRHGRSDASGATRLTWTSPVAEGGFLFGTLSRSTAHGLLATRVWSVLSVHIQRRRRRRQVQLSSLPRTPTFVSLPGADERPQCRTSLGTSARSVKAVIGRGVGARIRARTSLERLNACHAASSSMPASVALATDDVYLPDSDDDRGALRKWPVSRTRTPAVTSATSQPATHTSRRHTTRAQNTMRARAADRSAHTPANAALPDKASHGCLDDGVLSVSPVDSQEPTWGVPGNADPACTLPAQVRRPVDVTQQKRPRVTPLEKKFGRTAGKQASAGTLPHSTPGGRTHSVSVFARAPRPAANALATATSLVKEPEVSALQVPADACGRTAYRLYAERARAERSGLVSCTAAPSVSFAINVGSVLLDACDGPTCADRLMRHAPPPAMPVRPRPRPTSRLQAAQRGQHHAQRPAATTHLRTVAAQSKAHEKAAQRGKNVDDTRVCVRFFQAPVSPASP